MGRESATRQLLDALRARAEKDSSTFSKWHIQSPTLNQGTIGRERNVKYDPITL